MDIKQLRTFLAFAKDESYNKASQKLNYSVSTLVSHVSTLEDELHVELVNSKGRKSYLTEAGKLFVPYASRMVNLYDEAYAALNLTNNVAGNLTITTSETIADEMADAYHQFTSKYPDINLTVRVGALSSSINSLLEQTTDLVLYQDFAPPSDSQISSEILAQRKLWLLASPKHPLASKTEIHLEDLKGQSFVFPTRRYTEQPAIRDMLKSVGCTIQDNLFLDSKKLIKNELMGNLNLTFIPMSSSDSDIKDGSLVRLPWAESPIYMTLYAMYNATTLRRTAVDAFIAFSRTVMDK